MVYIYAGTNTCNMKKVPVTQLYSQAERNITGVKVSCPTTCNANGVFLPNNLKNENDPIMTLDLCPFDYKGPLLHVKTFKELILNYGTRHNSSRLKNTKNGLQQLFFLMLCTFWLCYGSSNLLSSFFITSIQNCHHDIRFCLFTFLLSTVCNRPLQSNG